MLTTPYVIRDWPERAFIDYLERELARMTAKRPPRAIGSPAIGQAREQS